MLKNFVRSSLLLLLGFLTTHANAQFTQLVVFGDSLSDNGNVFALSGSPPPPYFNGVFSNGPVWPDLAAAAWGIPQTNLAHGGALTGLTNSGNPLNPQGGTGSVYDVAPLPGMLAQVELYASQVASADAGALYVVFAGGNDFLALGQPPQVLGAFGASLGLDPFDPGFATAVAFQLIVLALDNVANTEALSFVGGAVSIQAGAVPYLYSLGARNIMVVSMPDVSATPSIIGLEAVAPGTQATFKTLVDNYNTTLDARLDVLRSQFPDLNLISYDSAAALREILADPAAFGITNTTETCLTTVICADPDSYIFWDGIHPTAVIQQLTADQIMAAAEASLAPVAALPEVGGGTGGPLFLLMALGLLALRRR